MTWPTHPFESHPGIPGECRHCPFGEEARIHQEPADGPRVALPGVGYIAVCGCSLTEGEPFDLGMRAAPTGVEVYHVGCGKALDGRTDGGEAVTTSGSVDVPSRPAPRVEGVAHASLLTGLAFGALAGFAVGAIAGATVAIEALQVVR